MPLFDLCFEVIEMETDTFTNFGLFTVDKTVEVEEYFYKLKDTVIATTALYDPIDTNKISSYFLLDDFYCVGDTVSTNIENTTQTSLSLWHIQSDLVDTTIQSPTLHYTFSTPGTYQITHTIWFLGCDYSHTEWIEVIPPPEITFETSSLCEAPVSIEAFSSTNATQFIWQNGSEGNTLSADTSGIYVVSATTAYCSATDSILLAINDTFDIDLALQLPQDTVVCTVDMPYILTPQSDYGNEFWMEDEIGVQFELSESGRYDVYFFKDDCQVSKSFNLKVKDCNSPVYFPNVFSPNDDGINDWFFPQGNDYEALQLRIYDRWGGVQFESSTTDPRWNGKFGNRPVPTGVYVYQFDYRNTLTGEMQQETGTVVVVY